VSDLGYAKYYGFGEPATLLSIKFTNHVATWKL